MIAVARRAPITGGVSVAKRPWQNPLFLTALLLLSFGAFLLLLHGAQSLAIRGTPLPTGSFEAVKKASYRVILRDEIDRPITVTLQNGNGEAISAAKIFQPHETRWKIFKARAATKNARLVAAGKSGLRFELQRMDERAPLREWLAVSCFVIALAGFCFALRDHAAVQALALGSAYFIFLLPWDAPAAYSLGSDNRYYIPTSLSLLQSGHWNLDQWVEQDSASRLKSDYRLKQGRDGHWFNFYPPGTAVLALPIALMGDWLNDQDPDDFERCAAVSSLAAKLFSAATIALFYLVVRQLTKRHALVWIVTLIFALATPQLGTHGGGLWSHNASVLCCALALGCWLWKDGRYAALAAVPLAFGFACRPSMIIPGFAFAIALLFRDRKKFTIFTGIALLGAAVFVFHSWSLWGTFLPPYYIGHAEGENANGFSAYLGTLFSPNRGLFVFCPVLLLALPSGFSLWRHRGPGGIYVIATLVAIAEWLAASGNRLWWGGHCYGPRLLCELLPFAILLIIPAWESIEKTSCRKAFLLFGFFASAWGIFVQAQALANPRVYDWSASPNIDFHPERLWDWRDWQIFAGSNDAPLP